MTRYVMIGAVLGLTAVAHGQPTPSSPQVAPSPPVAASPTLKADALLAEAGRLYADDADYVAARAKFEAAYNVVPSWKALNGVALCHRALGNYVAAYQTYKRLLGEFGNTLDPKQVEWASKRMAEVRRKVGALVVEATQTGARVSVNGADIGTAPLTRTMLVEPGRQVVVAKLTRHVPFIARVSVGANGTVRVPVKLQPERERLVVKLTDRPMKRRMKRWIPWATVGAGAALAGIGGVFMLSAGGDLDEFDERVAAMAGPFPMSVSVDSEKLNSGESKRSIATGLYVAGGLAVVTGVVLAILNQPRPVKQRGRLTVSPGGAAVVFQF